MKCWAVQREHTRVLVVAPKVTRFACWQALSIFCCFWLYLTSIASKKRVLSQTAAHLGKKSATQHGLIAFCSRRVCSTPMNICEQHSAHMGKHNGIMLDNLLPVDADCVYDWMYSTLSFQIRTLKSQVASKDKTFLLLTAS